MTRTQTLDRGRSAFQRHLWGEAYGELSAADGQRPLSPDDLERLAIAAYLAGKEDASAAALERAHHQLQRQDDVAGAVRCAFWLAFQLLNRGEMARGGGWLARAQRLLDDRKLDCVEQGYLLVPVALQAIARGDPSTAHAVSGQAAALGERFGDPDLVTLGRLGQGQALIGMGHG